MPKRGSRPLWRKESRYSLHKLALSVSNSRRPDMEALTRSIRDALYIFTFLSLPAADVVTLTSKNKKMNKERASPSPPKELLMSEVIQAEALIYVAD
jgi:hypothetical protein